MKSSHLRAISFALLILTTKLVRASDCPASEEMSRPGWLIEARAHYHFDTLPGRNGRLIAGYQFDPATIPQSAGLTITHQYEYWACTGEVIVTERNYEFGPTNDLSVYVFVGQDRTDDVWDLLLHRKLNALGFVNDLGSELGIDLGDWSLIYLDAAVPLISFVRNNVAINISMSADPSFDLLAFAQAIDAQLLAKPTYTNLSDSGLLPHINQFALDLPVGTQPTKLQDVPLLLDVVDPSGLPLTHKLRTDKGDSRGIAAMNLDQGPPPSYSFQPFLSGPQEIKLMSYNTLGLVARASLSVDVLPGPGDPKAIIGNLPSTVECVSSDGTEGTPVPVDGTASLDPDGSIVSYSWQPSERFRGSSHSPTATASFPVGNAQLSLTVVDNDGHTDQAVARVAVVDTTPPTFDPTYDAPPADAVVECDAVPARAFLLGQDPCSKVTDSFSETRVDHCCPHNYDLVRTWTAVDDYNNSAQHVQTVSVVDTHAPVLHNMPDSLMLRCDEPLPAPADVVAEDNCAGLVPVHFEQTTIAGTCPDNYVVRRLWSAADACENGSSYVQTIAVADEIEPISTALLRPQQLPLSPATPASVCSAPTARAFTVVCSATDVCDPAPVVTATLRVSQHTVSDLGECSELVDDITVDCAETVQIALRPPACIALGPTSAQQPLSVDSRGVKHVHGENVALVVTAIDRCGNRGDATYDPAIEPSPLCEQTLPDGACCPAITPGAACATACLPHRP